jgi:large subunit ribosomal protein L4
MYRGAMQSILSELVRQNRLIVIENLEIEKPKTKSLIAKLNQFGFSEALIVTEVQDTNLYLSSRNIPKIDVRQVQDVDPVSLIKFEKVLMTVDAIRKFEEVLG